MEQPHQEQIAILMVPFPAQGHLNQLLQLSCLVSSYKIPVYYVASPIFACQARSRANGLNPLDIQNISFHEIPTPHFDSPSPDPNSPTKFPTQLQLAWYASLDMREPFAAFLRHMSEKFKRIVVIHDPLMSFVVHDVVSVPNAESYVFNCISAASQVSLLWRGGQKPASIEFPKELPSLDGCILDEVLYIVSLQSEPLAYRSGDLHNTCRLIEARYMDILENKEVSKNKKAWAIGPILPTELSSDHRHKCLDWLDEHEPRSVVYVSFGTTVSLQDEQIREIALGLEQSKVKFLSVLRDADKGNVFDGQVRRADLPGGFERRVEGRGMVVRDWAPQPPVDRRVREPLRVELIHRKYYYYGCAHGGMAHAFRPPGEHCADNGCIGDGDCCEGMGTEDEASESVECRECREKVIGIGGRETAKEEGGGGGGRRSAGGGGRRGFSSGVGFVYCSY